MNVSQDSLTTLLSAEPEALDPYAERILEAAYDELLEHGLRRTSMDEIARRAGVGRATVFRRFANRDQLLRAVVAREVRRAVAIVDHRIARADSVEERVTTGFLAFVEHLRGHPLLRRLLVTDADAVLPLLTINGDAPLAMARTYIATQLRRDRVAGAAIAADPDELGELLARIALSLVLTPQSVLPLESPDQLAETVRTTILPLILSGNRD